MFYKSFSKSNYYKVNCASCCFRYYDVRETKPKIFARLIERHGRVEQLCKVDMTPKKYAIIAVICEETGYPKLYCLIILQ